ncbi:MATE family efflux transporter Mmp [Luedemannella flava]|uniref:MATE family efflux transporter Mmp n=1 Tax=Luedemannella flava TaxID=349316 RepID=A0ABN2LSJ7_9ACTN
MVLAAEPLYLLVDTAVVGHLGSAELAALAIGGGLLALVAWLGNVLAYGTTGSAARLFGAGDRTAAVVDGVQASWLALAGGVGVALLVQLVAGPLTRTLAGNADPGVAEAAEGWLRIAVLGAPGILLAMAGNGWMRGVQDTARPMRYVLGANLISAALCPVLVYPLGLGLNGSAIANVVAQTLSGALFVRALLVAGVPLAPHPGTLRRQLVVGRDLLVRGAAFQACFLSAAAVGARYGAATLAAHQIGLQLWSACALALDSIAIAGQALVGAALGGGDVPGARRTARRLTVVGGWCGLGFAIVIGAGAFVLPGLFSGDAAVRERALVAWPWFVAMLPLAGVVFALDGVFIGAGDVRFLRNLTLVAALAFFLPAIWLGYRLDLGIGGLWAALSLFVVVRLVGLLARVAGGRWAVAGAPT